MEKTTKKVETQGVENQEVRKRAVSKYTAVKTFASTVDRLKEAGMLTSEEYLHCEQTIINMTKKLFEL